MDGFDFVHLKIAQYVPIGIENFTLQMCGYFWLQTLKAAKNVPQNFTKIVKVHEKIPVSYVDECLKFQWAQLRKLVWYYQVILTH